MKPSCDLPESEALGREAHSLLLVASFGQKAWTSPVGFGLYAWSSPALGETFSAASFHLQRCRAYLSWIWVHFIMAFPKEGLHLCPPPT